jgi:hypothetical protein
MADGRFVIALPHELTLEQARRAVQDWVRDNFTRKGLIADVTIHAPSADGDERNMHAHVMVVMRKLDGSEFVRTKERFDTYSEKAEAKKAELEAVRESWARIGNRHLERYGFEPTLDHRTLEAQGLQREPTVHMEKSATAIEREGNPSELGDLNRAINAENERKGSTLRPSAQCVKHGRRQRARSRTSGPWTIKNPVLKTRRRPYRGNMRRRHRLQTPDRHQRASRSRRTRRKLSGSGRRMT